MKPFPSSVNHHLFFIFGSGKVGMQAFNYFKNRGICVLIDKEPLIKELKTIIKPIGLPFLFQNLPEDFILTQSSHKYRRHYFIQGDITQLAELLYRFLPEYLIPAAPVHVMADLFLAYLQSNYKERKPESLDLVKLNTFSISIPSHLNFTRKENNKYYFSYAKFDELCPDNCLGPEQFCPTFQREKSESVSEFVKRIVPVQSFFSHFISEQIDAGLGGIHYHELLDGLTRFSRYLQDLDPQKFSNFTITTTCNCHGVLESYKI